MSEPFNPPRILRSWVDQVLAGEHDDDRFETFANEVVSAVEGKTIVSTSKSWDLGRDGRGLGPAHGIFVLSSLRSDIDKPKADAIRLKATTWKIRHVYYAAPRLVSEAVMETHCKAIRAVLGEEVDVDRSAAARSLNSFRPVRRRMPSRISMAASSRPSRVLGSRYGRP